MAKDRIQLRTSDDAAAIAALKAKFDVEASVHEGQVTFGAPTASGAEFLPRLFAELGVPIQAVSVARPTLDDVFLAFTGRAMRDAEQLSAAEKMKANPFVRMRR